MTEAQNGTDLHGKSYTYTPAGDISTILDQVANVTFAYTYDGLHHLKTETSFGVYSDASFTYNAIGNLTQRTQGTNTLNYTYAAAGHKHAVSKVTVNGTAKNFGYDANGNLTSGFDLSNLTGIVARTFTYNADNMPLTINRAGKTTTFTYDGGGARAKKVGQNGTTYYVGDHYAEENGVATKYILAGGERIAKKTANATYYFHKDHLGSSTLMTNAAGTVVESASYTPFGEFRSRTVNPVTNYNFTGQELDPETGLYNYNARLYDPALGRFISADTIVPDFADPQSLNRYSYCRNNPLVYVDPSGHFNLFKEIGRVFKQVGKEISRAFKKHGPLIAAIIVAAVVAPYASLYISHLAIPGGIGPATAGWAMAGEIGGAAIAGAAAGATAGGLSASLNGGDVGDATLRGAGYGAISGAAFGAIGSHYGNKWNLGRASANALAGGGISELSGQGSGNGALFSGGSALGRFAYNEIVHYDTDWNPGGKAVEKFPDTYPVRGANNIGTQGGSVNPDGWWNEGGRVSRLANHMPGINAVSGVHDVFQINLDQWGGNIARNTFNVPGMLPAAAITYGALMTDMSAILVTQ